MSISTLLSTGQKGVINLLVPIIVLIVGSIFISNNIQTNTKFADDQDVQGVLIAKGEGGLGSSNRGNSEEHRNNENSGERNTTNSQQSENRGSSESSNQGGKTRIEIRNGIVTEFEMEEATPSASPSPTPNQIENRIRSISKFPLRIDLQTNQLIMTKNGVERVLTVLPEQAVQNMLRAHLKKGLGPKFFEASSSASPSATPEGTPSASPTASASATPVATSSAEPTVTESSTDITVLESQIELEERDGKPVYKIPALKHLKLFGFIPTTTQFTDFISVETGSLIEEQQSLLARFLDLLSP